MLLDTNGHIPSAAPEQTPAPIPPGPSLPASPIDAAIAAAADAAAAVRAELTPLADVVSAAAGEFARGWWEGEARRVISQNPTRATENASKFPQLKAELREMQSNAIDLARGHFAETFADASVDARVAEIVKGPRAQLADTVATNVVDRVWEEPLRYLLGDIGPALNRAGLTTSSLMSLDTTSAIDPAGRYRYGLTIPDEFVAATAFYDGKLAELAAAITAVDELEVEKLREYATSLWDDA